jgi:hypothetical protein
MGKSFRADDLNQPLLFPPSLHDWLPDNHLAASFPTVQRVDPAPAMMVRVLLYGYCDRGLQFGRDPGQDL